MSCRFLFFRSNEIFIVSVCKYIYNLLDFIKMDTAKNSTTSTAQTKNETKYPLTTYMLRSLFPWQHVYNMRDVSCCLEFWLGLVST